MTSSSSYSTASPSSSTTYSPTPSSSFSTAYPSISPSFSSTSSPTPSPSWSSYYFTWSPSSSTSHPTGSPSASTYSPTSSPSSSSYSSTDDSSAPSPTSSDDVGEGFEGGDFSFFLDRRKVSGHDSVRLDGCALVLRRSDPPHGLMQQYTWYFLTYCSEHRDDRTVLRCDGARGEHSSRIPNVFLLLVALTTE